MSTKLPSVAECTAMMDHYKMLPNIRAHSICVASVAATLLKELGQNSNRHLPDKELVIKGALLHDIAKTPCLQGKCLHAEVGAQICLDHGYPLLAEIVKEHVSLKEYPVENWKKGLFQAKEIVFYADKRVNHDQIVSLKKRLGYILLTYGQNRKDREKFIMENFLRCEELEKAIFSFIRFEPDELCPEAGEVFFERLQQTECIHHDDR